MNYLKIYNDIIERSKNRKINGYKEKHHIIPRCMNGNDDVENIAILTLKEHFICHMLLCKIYPTNNKLKFAIWCMSMHNNNQKRYKISGKTYEHLRKQLKNIPKTEETKLKLSESHKGIIPWNKGKIEVYSEEILNKFSESHKDIIPWNKGKYGEISEETRKKQSESHKGQSPINKGVPMSDEQKNKLKNSLKGRKVWNKGIPMSEEQKEKIRNTKLKNKEFKI